MATPAFPDITRIEYEGPQSKNPLAFKHYYATEKLDGKTLRDHLRFAVCYWHTFRNPLSDPFGAGTALRPWDDGSNSVAHAPRRARGVRVHRKTRRAVLLFPRPRCGTRRQKPSRDQPEPGRRRQGAQGRATA